MGAIRREIIGCVVRHAEAFTISDYLTVWEDAPGK